MDFIIGIDLGGTNTRIGLLDERFQLREKTVFSTGRFNDKDSLINALCISVLELLSRRNIKREMVLGIGIGLPGPVDSQKGIVHYFPNIPGWRNVYLSRIIRRRTGIVTFIDNDVNLITLAEFSRGAGRGSKNMFCLTLGTGVGGGIIVDGRLYRGSSLSAGEIGHIPLTEDGPECGCGARGCLESYIGNRQIMNMAEKRFGPISLEDLSRKAKTGNKQAIKIWQDVGRHLGLALSGMVNFFNPDCIVIGGGVSEAGGILFNTVRKIIRIRAMAPAKNAVRIVKAGLGQDAGIIGAALLVGVKSVYLSARPGSTQGRVLKR